VSEEEFQRDMEEEDGLKAEIEKCGARTIGEFLSYERQRKGLSLEEIDQVSRIGPRWLEAIDKGEWSAYPSLIYAKGHIRGYASVLGFDGSRIIAEFEEELKKAFPDETFHIHPVRNINQIYQPTSGDHRGGGRYKFLLLGILLTFFMILVISKAIHRKDHPHLSVVPQAVPTPPTQTLPSPAQQPASPALSPGGPQSSSIPSPPPALTGASAESKSQSSAPESGQGNVGASGLSSQSGKPSQSPGPSILKVQAVRDTWVGVRIDGGKEMEIPLDRGQWRLFHGKTFRISTDDGGSLMLFLNKGPLGKAGEDDQPVREKLISAMPVKKNAVSGISR
jgi:cytoskeleton protein RodZ